MGARTFHSSDTCVFLSTCFLNTCGIDEWGIERPAAEKEQMAWKSRMPSPKGVLWLKGEEEFRRWGQAVQKGPSAWTEMRRERDKRSGKVRSVQMKRGKKGELYWALRQRYGFITAWRSRGLKQNNALKGTTVPMNYAGNSEHLTAHEQRD